MERATVGPQLEHLVERIEFLNCRLGGEGGRKGVWGGGGGNFVHIVRDGDKTDGVGRSHIRDIHRNQDRGGQPF